MIVTRHISPTLDNEWIVLLLLFSLFILRSVELFVQQPRRIILNTFWFCFSSFSNWIRLSDILLKRKCSNNFVCCSCIVIFAYCTTNWNIHKRSQWSTTKQYMDAQWRWLWEPTCTANIECCSPKQDKCKANHNNLWHWLSILSIFCLRFALFTISFFSAYFCVFFSLFHSFHFKNM